MMKYHGFLSIDEPGFEVGSVLLDVVRGQRNLLCSEIPLNETLFPDFSHMQILGVANRNSDPSDPVSGASATAEIYTRNHSHFQACVYVVGGLPNGETVNLNWFAFQPKTLHLRTNKVFYGGSSPVPVYDSNGDQCIDQGSNFKVSRRPSSLVQY